MVKAKNTKAIAKKMRELSNQAYELELRMELERLEEQFTLWRKQQIDSWDLQEAIHKFHNGPARELYKRYSWLSPAEVLPYALYKKLITYEELPEEVVEEMKMQVDMLYFTSDEEYSDENE